MSIDTLIIKPPVIHSLEKYPLCAAFGLGIVTALSLPPLGLFFAPLLSFPLILYLVYQSAHLRRAVLTGFLFALGYFSFGLYWTTAAFYLLLRDVMWLIPFSMIGFPSLLAATWIPAFIAAYITRHHIVLSVLTFITALIWAEYFRGHSILNFPWNLMGYGLYRLPPFLQISSVVGIYGLTFFFLAISTLPLLIVNIKETKSSQIILGVSTLIIVAIFSLGTFRIASSSLIDNKSVAVQIIHPDISQAEKLTSSSDEQLIQKYIALTKNTGNVNAPTLISIWPENTLSLYQDRELFPLQTLTQNLPDNAYVLVGAERFFPQSDGKGKTFNSMIVLNKDGDIITDYNKHILAPGGESLPHENIFRQTFFQRLLKDTTFLAAGDGATTLHIKNIPAFAPQICYETAYAGYTPHGQNRPEFIVVISNDNWADYTTQPYQAFVQTQVRAIEEGLPVLRAANKGISAIIDPYGRVIQSLNNDETGTINGYLPTALSPTFYARYGDTPFLIFLSGLSAILLIVVYVKKRSL